MKITKFLIFLLISLAVISCSGNKNQPKSPANNSTTQTNQPNNAVPRMTNGKYNLRLNLQKGKTYYLKMLTNQSITQTIQKQKMESKQGIGVSYSFIVDDVAPTGIASLKVMFNSFLQQLENPSGKMSYNSTDPADKDNPFAKIYAPLIGKTFNIKLAPDGKVTELSGVDALLKSVIKGMDIKDEQQSKALEMQISQQFSDKSIGEMMENMLAIYPENPIAIGDSWSKSYTMVKNFPASFDNTWTLKEVKDNKAIVQLSAKIKSVKIPQRKDAPPMPTYNINGEQTGTIEIDLASGWVLNSKLSQKLSGKVSLAKSDQVKEAISIPISIESTITTQAVK